MAIGLRVTPRLRAIASLQPGEVVLDLGSGAGFDRSIADPKADEPGQVIGVDMTE